MFEGNPYWSECITTISQPKFEKREQPYHIDYCFIPDSWVPSILSVEVGAYKLWITASDHCPQVVDIALP